MDLAEQRSPASGDPVSGFSGTAERAGGPGPGVRPATRGRAHPRRRWQFRCRDAVNRRHPRTVLVGKDRTVLSGTPGGTAVLSADRPGRPRVALLDAADRAGRGR